MGNLQISFVDKKSNHRAKLMNMSKYTKCALHTKWGLAMYFDKAMKTSIRISGVWQKTI